MGPVAFELETDSGGKVPGDIFVLVNHGRMQKMSRVVDRQIAAIPNPEGDGVQRQRIQVFRRIASGVVGGGTSTGCILPCQDAGLGDLRLRIVSHGTQELTNACDTSEVNLSNEKRHSLARCHASDEKMHTHGVQADSNFAEYLAKHRLQEVLANSMRHVLEQQPHDPFELLISALQKAQTDAGFEKRHEDPGTLSFPAAQSSTAQQEAFTTQPSNEPSKPCCAELGPLLEAFGADGCFVSGSDFHLDSATIGTQSQQALIPGPKPSMPQGTESGSSFETSGAERFVSGRENGLPAPTHNTREKQALASSAGVPCSAALLEAFGADECFVLPATSYGTTGQQAFGAELTIPYRTALLEAFGADGCFTLQREMTLPSMPAETSSVQLSSADATTSSSRTVDPFTSCPVALGQIRSSDVIGDTTSRPCLSKIYQNRPVCPPMKKNPNGSSRTPVGVGTSRPCLSQMLQNCTSTSPTSQAVCPVGKEHCVSSPGNKGDTTSRLCLSKVLLQQSREARYSQNMEPHVDSKVSEQSASHQAISCIHMKANTILAEGYRSGHLEQLLKKPCLDVMPDISDKIMSPKLFEKTCSKMLLMSIQRPSTLLQLKQPAQALLAKIIDASLEGTPPQSPKKVRAASLRGSPRRRQQVGCMRRFQSVPRGGQQVECQVMR